MRLNNIMSILYSIYKEPVLNYPAAAFRIS